MSFRWMKDGETMRRRRKEEEEGEGGGGMKMRKEGGAYLPVLFVKQRSLARICLGAGREGAGFVVCVSATTAHTAGRRAQRDHQ